jgi:signal transduction histidine kinase
MSCARSSTFWSRLRWRSIGARLTAWYFGVFVASTLLLAAAASLSIRSSVRTQENQIITTELVEHRQVFEAEGIAGLKRLVATPSAASRPLYVRVVDREHGTLFEYRAGPEVAFPTPAAPPEGDAPVVRTVRGQNAGATFRLASVALSKQLHLQIARSDAPTQQVFGHLRAGLFVVWLGAVALGLLGGFYLTRRALKPVGRLTAAARQVIESGDLALRVPVRGTGDELDEMTRLFNGVLSRNEALVRGMREALDNVAHDLRTPLTRLRTGAEVALASAAPEQLRDALADGIEESERVLAMLTTLMDISEAETGVMKLQREPVDLAALGRQVIDLYEHVAAERGIRFVTHLDFELVVPGDRNRLHQVLANLVDNAIKYTAAGGQVELSTGRDGRWACVAVKDSGMGIAEGDLPRIWQRLYRADRSRSERGLGLGLSFVKAIVAAHGGEVAVASELGVGSTFTVKLPAG